MIKAMDLRRELRYFAHEPNTSTLYSVKALIPGSFSYARNVASYNTKTSWIKIVGLEDSHGSNLT